MAKGKKNNRKGSKAHSVQKHGEASTNNYIDLQTSPSLHGNSESSIGDSTTTSDNLDLDTIPKYTEEIYGKNIPKDPPLLAEYMRWRGHHEDHPLDYQMDDTRNYEKELDFMRVDGRIQSTYPEMAAYFHRVLSFSIAHKLTIEHISRSRYNTLDEDLINIPLLPPKTNAPKKYILSLAPKTPPKRNQT
ncbi:hypothetical protein B7494_g4632 [Chlorociboria aeruginascens]|nr:hypothetical protein B7494_g4632 [Chlorociboria aeruginascens]